MRKPLSKTITPVGIETVNHYTVELGIMRPDEDPEDEKVEIVEFRFDEFVVAEANVQGNEW